MREALQQIDLESSTQKTDSITAFYKGALTYTGHE